jgi:hypothetical protein
MNTRVTVASIIGWPRSITRRTSSVLAQGIGLLDGVIAAADDDLERFGLRLREPVIHMVLDRSERRHQFISPLAHWTAG